MQPPLKYRRTALVGSCTTSCKARTADACVRYRAIPLPSPEIVEKAPMISQLIKELGVELSTVLQPSSEIVKEMSGKHHGVFHVENALGSPYIPAQQEFVVRYGITSVLGFRRIALQRRVVRGHSVLHRTCRRPQPTDSERSPSM